MIYERIKQLCKENGISVSELEKRIGVAKGYLCKIDKHKTSQEKAEAIAVELNTTVDFLTKGIEKTFVKGQAKINIELQKQSPKVKEYMLKFAKLPEEKRKQIMSFIDMIEEKEGGI